MANWDKIRQEYINANGDVILKELAEKHGVKSSTLRSRKNREKWDDDINGVATHNATQRKNVATIPKPIKEKATKVVEELEDADLTEMQRLFCLYYVKSFNATQSAIKAGYSKDTAHVQGPRLLGNVRVRAEIKRLKGSMQEDIFVNAMDILNKYIEIAFADVTDYVKFGQKETQVMGMYGPLEDGDGNPVMETVNYVDLKDSSTVDGTLITEISQGRDGVKVKLADKMKALEKLEQYFDLLPDHHKRKLEEEKLQLARDKFKLIKTKAEGSEEELQKLDKLIEAIDHAAKS